MTRYPPPDGLPQGTRIGRTALRVDDLEEVRGFYQDVVGLDVLHHADDSCTLGVEETPLLVLERNETGRKRQRSSAGLFHNAFRVPSREALGDALVRIRERWRLSGASDHWVSEALYLRDPEENGVELYRDFPRSEWPLDDDGTVRIGTEPLGLEHLEAAASDRERLPPGTDVGHVHLEVRSLDAFSECYVEASGFEVQETVAGAQFVSAGGYHHHLGANTWGRRTEPAGGRGLAWFEVVLPETAGLEGLRERLAATSYTVVETADGLSVTDPDGMEVRFRVEA
ncbi:VOC family protein [Natronobiforma cellulositropha]|uniref:VOC family protein n=1 Tax=Natronobiforma cellulositropha TaxID=1679076 RepID=UPI0021D604BD|nr:VOC family protein [Natronobiforma cellulositropha]